MKKPKVGETYYAVPCYKSIALARIVKVESIGKKYFQADGMKFDKETFIQFDKKGYSPEYELYDDEESYKLKVRADECWRSIIDRLYLKMTDKEIIELYDKLYERYYGTHKSI